MDLGHRAGAGKSAPNLDKSALTELVLRSRSFVEVSAPSMPIEAQLEQRVAERTAQLEEANRSKDRLIAMVSHELRTPLVPALLALESLHSRRDLPADVYEELRLIQRNVQMEARLIDDLLDLTRVSRGKLSLTRVATDVHAVLRDAVAVCRNKADAKQQVLQMDLPADCAMVLADAARLQQVFWNLLENAVKFTPQHGTISVRSACEENWLRIDITDSGVGIEPQMLAKIFEAFEQGDATSAIHPGGLGLGLAIARGLVEAHGGTLTVHSDGKEKGATFTVKLPLMPRQRSPDFPVAKSEKTVESSPRALRLLLVEDHEDTRRALERLLQRRGYIVASSGSLKGAMQQLDRASFDLLITDIGLPDGSGHDLLAAMGDRVKSAIAVSGFAGDDDINASQLAGFAAHVTKPIDFAKLKEVIDSVASNR